VRAHISLLFVYGTLHPDRAPAEMLPTVSRLKVIGPATMTGTLHNLGPYPGVTLPGTQIIPGHLFQLPEDSAVLAVLDTYEGFDPRHPETSLFLRIEHIATLPTGTHEPCWLYLYNGLYNDPLA
jgi:gamma-glutamylcyclotransferase (GGCT)/AIG2-like uncharacterized protein YtfP